MDSACIRLINLERNIQNCYNNNINPIDITLINTNNSLRSVWYLYEVRIGVINDYFKANSSESKNVYLNFFERINNDIKTILGL